MSVFRLNNRAARRVFLDRHLLGGPPSGPVTSRALAGLIADLGFVQLDSVRTVERAHDMILFARRQAYRPRHLPPLLHKHRSVFEHWTHDAAIIPMAFYPYWHERFRRDAEMLQKRWSAWRGTEFQDNLGKVLDYVRSNGCCGSGDLAEKRDRKGDGWWDWQPSKTALEYLWRSGTLSIRRRDGFRKIYDLTDRVIPEDARQNRPDASQMVDWCNNAALDRLGFATSGQLAAFWDSVTVTEAKNWCQTALAGGDVIEIDVEGADGIWRRHLARPDLPEAAHDAPEPPNRIRVLSPFDPALRDRIRAERLFGFCYRIEIYTPAEKRIYGYYVFPLLEKDRLIGRIDMKANRDTDELYVTALWPEAKVRWSTARQARLDAELVRVARFASVSKVTYAENWLREAQPS